MAIKLNLLPVEKRVGKGLQRVLRITRMLGVIALGTFIVFGLGLGAFFIFNSVRLNNLNSANSALEGKIAALETSETKMILLKDRVGKIRTLMNIPSAIVNLDIINGIISPVSAANINELNVGTAKISTTLRFESAGDIGIFLKGLSESDAFQSVSITTFSFNPVGGYLVGVAIVTK